MTKIGEGKEPHELPSQAVYQRQFHDSVVKFQVALNCYSFAKDDEEQVQFTRIMDQQMEVINSSIKELKWSGLQKQSNVVNSDYQKFKNAPTGENLTALQQDTATLKEYSMLPENSQPDKMP